MFCRVWSSSCDFFGDVSEKGLLWGRHNGTVEIMDCLKIEDHRKGQISYLELFLRLPALPVLFQICIMAQVKGMPESRPVVVKETVD